MPAVLPSLILFARVPALGRVKTRLVPRLTEPGALRLYRAFLEDASRIYAGRGEWDAVLAAEPDPEALSLAEIFPAPEWRREAQGEGDLGERLTAAFSREFGRGAAAAVAVGSDHPALSRASVAEALARALAGEACAAVPADDGGYCAIAMPSGSPFREVFRNVPWSTGEVLEVTRARLSARGLGLSLLPAGWDVDRPEDVDRLRRELALRDPSAADFPTATALALAELP